MSTSSCASRKRRHDSGDMDRISNLPEGIMEHILFHYLPASDSIRMSFVSKTWQRLWKSLPVSDYFCFDRKEEESMEEFVTSVDDSLAILHEQEHRRHIIPSFCLSGIVGGEIQSSHVDRWMKLVTKHYVQSLVLDNEGIPMYKFPPAAFDIGSLVELSLENCTLKKHLVQEDTRFCCLKELELRDVDVDELVIEDLLSRCPSLETLELHCCKNIKYLELVDLPKLRRVSLTDRLVIGSEVYKYKIELASLQALSYSGMLNPLDLEAICCSNLEKLDLCTFGNAITNKYIQELILRFPSLSDLALRASCFVGDEIKISSNQLKSLRMTGNICTKNMIIDAPNLLSYHGKSKYIDYIPSSCAVNSKKLNLVHHDFVDVRIDTKWFLKLREYLGKFSPAKSTLSICRSHVPVTVEISLAELQKQNIIPPPPEVMELVLEHSPWSLDYRALIDGLLWSSHPIMIRMPRRNNSNLIKFVYRTLMEREENPQCCRDSHIKCWRHYLKSAEYKGFYVAKDGRTSYISDSAVSLLDFEEVKQATFKLQW